MAENMSLADQAVQALAMVKAIDETVDNAHPERHVVRSMKRVAEQALAAAFRNAIDMAWQAKDLQETARKLEASAKPHNALGQEPCADVCARSPAPTGCASNGDTEK